MSQWGASFRPEYDALQGLRSAFPGVPIGAFTATADEVTRKDIIAKLFGGKVQEFVSGFDRPNIRLTVKPKNNTTKQLLEFLAFNRARSREAAEVIESVERVLRSKLDAHHAIARVARELGMSERTLRRRLAESGVSFQGVLDGLKKNRALELLANPQMSVEQIAFAVGFTDPHNFRRAFRRWTGSTPGMLREDLSANWPK